MALKKSFSSQSMLGTSATDGLSINSFFPSFSVRETYVRRHQPVLIDLSVWLAIWSLSSSYIALSQFDQEGRKVMAELCMRFSRWRRRCYVQLLWGFKTCSLLQSTQTWKFKIVQLILERKILHFSVQLRLFSAVFSLFKLMCVKFEACFAIRKGRFSVRSSFDFEAGGKLKKKVRNQMDVI